MKGIVLAGGAGTRMREFTGGRNKHLLPVGGAPMVAHPLRRLVEAGIHRVLVVSSPSGTAELSSELGNGDELGCSLAFETQERAAGIAHALSLAEEFAAGEPVVTVLGDNLFDAPLRPHLAAYREGGATGAMVFLRRVPDPERFGVAWVEGDRVVDIAEKPSAPSSDLAVTGIYVYDGRFGELVRELRPSRRGEVEITDLNRAYLERGALRWRELQGRWVDAGTPASYRAAQRMFEWEHGDAR